MSYIPNFRTFKLLVMFSRVIFNYANSESMQKEWEEHSENIIILDSKKIKKFNSIKENYVILNDKRIAFNLNTKRDYELLSSS